MSFRRLPVLLLGLFLPCVAPFGAASAQSGHTGQYAVPFGRMPGMVSPQAGPFVGAPLAQPVVPPVPGVLSDRLPPRYDGLALGHSQFSNQPSPPVPDRPALSPGRDEQDLLDPESGLSARGGLDATPYSRGTSSGYGTTPYDVAPYPVPSMPARGDRSFGSSARIDGE